MLNSITGSLFQLKNNFFLITSLSENEHKDYLSVGLSITTARSKMIFLIVCQSRKMAGSRIIEWFELEETVKGHLAQPPAVSRDIFNQIKLLRAPSSLTLNISRDGASTASLGSPFQCFTTLTVKNFFLILRRNLLSFSLNHYSLSYHNRLC